MDWLNSLWDLWNSEGAYDAFGDMGDLGSLGDLAGDADNWDLLGDVGSLSLPDLDFGNMITQGGLNLSGLEGAEPIFGSMQSLSSPSPSQDLPLTLGVTGLDGMPMAPQDFMMDANGMLVPRASETSPFVGSGFAAKNLAALNAAAEGVGGGPSTGRQGSGGSGGGMGVDVDAIMRSPNVPSQNIPSAPAETPIARTPDAPSILQFTPQSSGNMSDLANLIREAISAKAFGPDAFGGTRANLARYLQGAP